MTRRKKTVPAAHLVYREAVSVHGEVFDELSGQSIRRKRNRGGENMSAEVAYELSDRRKILSSPTLAIKRSEEYQRHRHFIRLNFRLW